MILVVKAHQGTHYCGRASSYKPGYGVDCSALGNPFWMKGEGQRTEVCDKFEALLPGLIREPGPGREAFKVLYRALVAGEQVRLGCFCAPKRCHCDSIRAQLEFYT